MRESHTHEVLKFIAETQEAINCLSIYENSNIRDLNFHYSTLAECTLYLKQLRTIHINDIILPEEISQVICQDKPQDKPQNKLVKN